MKQTRQKLLKAGADVLGGDEQLASYLGISVSLLRRFMTGQLELPDPLLLQTTDLILIDRDAR